MLSWVTSFPSYLLALFALAVPIIIHLLSKSKGNPVAVGTLKFFQQLKPVKMTQVKLVEILLLALRLLMLICAVLLTAQLWWLDDKSTKNQEFYLVTSNWLNVSSNDEKRELAANLNENDAYILEAKLTPLSKEQILTWEKTNSSYGKPLWPALNSAHYTLPKNSIFHIYTDNSAINFIGEPLKVSQSIQWHVLTMTNKSPEPISLHITVVADPDRTQSVLRIKQALTLIKSTLIPELSIHIIENQQMTHTANALDDSTAEIINNTDWLFYFSSDDKSLLLQRALNQGVNIFIDAKSLQKNIKKTFQTTLISSENELLLEDAVLHKRGINTPINDLLTLAGLDDHYRSKTLWLSENGFAALVKHETFVEDKTQIIYQLNSRLEPKWSDFAEQPQFVRVLLALILNKKTETKQLLDPYSELENLKLTLAQIEAFDTSENVLKARETKKFLTLLSYKEQLLTQWLIILLVVFWCLERLLSENRLRENRLSQSKVSKNNQNSPIKNEST